MGSKICDRNIKVRVPNNAGTPHSYESSHPEEETTLFKAALCAAKENITIQGYSRGLFPRSQKETHQNLLHIFSWLPDG